MTVDSWIATVIAHARELREVGVLSLSCGTSSVSLAALPPPAPVFAEDKSSPDVEENFDALHDPASYPGGVVPGYRIERLKEP